MKSGRLSDRTTFLGVRVLKEQHRELKRLSALEHRPVSNLAREALAAYLDRKLIQKDERLAG